MKVSVSTFSAFFILTVVSGQIQLLTNNTEEIEEKSQVLGKPFIWPYPQPIKSPEISVIIVILNETFRFCMDVSQLITQVLTIKLRTKIWKRIVSVI